MRVPLSLAAVIAALAFTLPAAADGATRVGNSFGPGPNVNWTCSSGVPNSRLPVSQGFFPPFAPGTGARSCALVGVSSQSTFYAPGNGRFTRIRLPAMRNPGRMRTVVYRAVTALAATESQRSTACCTVERLGPVFKPRRNRRTSLRVNLRTQVDSPAQRPGEVSGADVLGIAVLDPGASLPLLDGGSDEQPFNAYLWHPAPRRATSEIDTPPYIAGYALLMNADWSPARR